MEKYFEFVKNLGRLALLYWLQVGKVVDQRRRTRTEVGLLKVLAYLSRLEGIFLTFKVYNVATEFVALIHISLSSKGLVVLKIFCSKTTVVLQTVLRLFILMVIVLNHSRLKRFSEFDYDQSGDVTMISSVYESFERFSFSQI